VREGKFSATRAGDRASVAELNNFRNDRQFVEARRICDDITNAALKDHLRTILVLQYSGLDASTITTALAANVRDKSDDTKAAEANVSGTPDDTKAVATDVRAKPDDTKVAA
jgi:hypothetical protein